MNINLATVKEAAMYVSGYFKANLNKCFRYHNLSHTSYVVNATDKLCDAMNVGKDKAILLTAAWFHDLGFTVQTEGHERAGAALAKDFLVTKGVDEDDIALVKSCILSTRYPQKPRSMLEEILCDADLLYLGEEQFFYMAALLRKEWKLTNGLVYTDEEWCRQNIRFLSAHRFHTSYGRNIVEGGKQRNIRCLKARLLWMGEGNPAPLSNKALPAGGLVKANAYALAS